MRIVLINPAFFDGKEFRNRFDDYLNWIKGGNLYVAPFEPPIGLAFLSAYLKERGHEVHLTEAYDGICEIPPARLKELYREINDYFYARSCSTERCQAG